MPGSSHGGGGGDLLTIEQIASRSIIQIAESVCWQNTPHLKRIMYGMGTGVIAPRLKDGLGECYH